MAGIAETTWLKLQVAHWLSSMRTICIRLHIARYSCLAKFSKTTSLCLDVFFVDFDQNEYTSVLEGLYLLIETSVKLQIWNVLFWLHFLFKYQTKMVKNDPKLKIEKSFRHPTTRLFSLGESKFGIPSGRGRFGNPKPAEHRWKKTSAKMQKILGYEDAFRPRLWGRSSFSDQRPHWHRVYNCLVYTFYH